MTDMKNEHIEKTIIIIKNIIFHQDYEKYIHVFDRDNPKNSTSIIDIEETILLALKKGDKKIGNIKFPITVPILSYQNYQKN
jgi:hypothetical protein